MKTIIQSIYVFALLFISSLAVMAQSDAEDCVGKRSTNPCTSIPDNVCGCDGKTYANPCAANAAGIKKFTTGPCKGNVVVVVDPGPKNGDSDCIGKGSSKPCKSIPDNVCGCDGKTYLNPCAAEAAGVKRFNRGPCTVKTGTGVTAPDDECIVKPDPRISINCINVFDPVCGCDGKEYPNECLARAAGVKRLVKGKCNQKPGNGHNDTPSPGCGAIYHHITTQPSDFYSPACKVVIDIYPIQSSNAIVADTVKKRFSLAKDVVITERDKCLENIFCVPAKVFNVGLDSSGVSDFKLFNDAIFKVEENGNFEVRTKKDRFLTGGTFSKPNPKNEIWSNCIYKNKNYAVRMTWIKGVVDNRNNFEAK